MFTARGVFYSKGCLVRAALIGVLFLGGITFAEDSVKIASQDSHIDSVDSGIQLFVRMKVAEGNRTFNNDNIVLFVHGATYPSTPDFDLQYKDYSWADWMVRHGYVVYMFDKRNYGFSTREKAMDHCHGKSAAFAVLSGDP